MKLSVKITLLLFAVIALFVVLTSSYFYTQMNKTFTAQAERLMLQSELLIRQRIELLKENLQSEMEQLASSLFTENETILASLLENPPDFSTEVVGFAERLRRRTTLDFLYIISTEGFVLSDSFRPAAFGKKDPRPDFPLEQTAYVYEDAVRLELKRRVTFGHRALYLRGGYFVRQRLFKLPVTGVRMEIQENPEEPAAQVGDSLHLIRTLNIPDYLGRTVMRIRAAVSREELQVQWTKLIRNSTILIVASFVLCLLTGHLFSLSISRPVARLRDAAEEMSLGNLDIRVQEEGSGEIRHLVQAFNRMAEQLQENRQKLIQTERIAAWQEIARHLAHEIKNPLTPIRTSITNLQVCLEKAPERFAEIFGESSESVLEEVEKLRHLADEFSRFARLPAPTLKRANLNEVIQRSILLYSGGTSVDIQFQPDAALPLFLFDAEQLSEVVHNLVQNAVDAVRTGGKIRICTAALQDDGGLWACFTVEDSGSGIDEETRKHVFAPYFTTKEKGTGLGLAIVHRIITEHGGKIFVASESGKGTKFEVRLPVV